MSNLLLTTKEFNLKLRDPFGIARGTTNIAKNVLITLSFADYVAYGEAAPSAYYGEDQRSVIDFINSFTKNRSLDQYLTNVPLLKEDLGQFNLNISNSIRSSLFSSSARVGVEIAFWDLIGKIQKKPLYKLLFPENPFLLKENTGGMPPTSYTIALDSIDEIVRKTKGALNNGFNLLKVKLGRGFEEDINILQAISEAAKNFEYKIRVDANCGWDLNTTKKMIDILPEYHIELIEQPLPKGQLHKLSGELLHSTIPIIADEDCVNISDVESLAGKVHGINIKLMKAGSLLEAIDMITLAKSYNLKIMIGCMIESSCSISAAVHLSPLVDYIDLDGHLLIENDPFGGLIIEKNRILPSFEDGLGIFLKETIVK